MMLECVSILAIRTVLLLSMFYLFICILNKGYKNKVTKNADLKAFLIVMIFQIMASIGISVKAVDTSFLESFSESFLFINIFLTFIITKKFYQNSKKNQ
ncbi:MAG: hypothetical protein ACRC30_03000 [Clostridium sp.]